MLLNHRPLHSSTTRCSLFHPLLHPFHSSTSSSFCSLTLLHHIISHLSTSSSSFIHSPFHPLASQSLIYPLLPLPFIVPSSTLFHLSFSFIHFLFHLHPPSHLPPPFTVSPSTLFHLLHPPSLSSLPFIHFLFHLLRPTALSCTLSHLHPFHSSTSSCTHSLSLLLSFTSSIHLLHLLFHLSTWCPFFHPV